MARYNTVTATTTSSGAATIGTPTQGLFTTLTGAAPYTLTLANPTLFIGQTQTFYNTTGGVVTLSTPSGNIVGSGFTGATSQTMPNNATYSLTSDGTNYVITNNEGGPAARSTFTASAAVTLSPAALVTISPTGGLTINPSSVAGSMDNVNIGATTAGTLRCSNITVTGTTTFSSGINSVAIGNSTASSGAFTTLSSSSTTTLAGATFSAATQVNSTLGCNGQVSFTGGIASSGTGSGTLVITGGLGVSGQITATTLVETSSIAFKENVQPIDNALDVIMALFGVTYDRKDNKEHEAGLIAEEVFKIAPDLVQLDENGNPYGVKYTKLGAYLIEAVKSLKQEINELKSK